MATSAERRAIDSHCSIVGTMSSSANARHALGRVERESVGDARAAVVADDREAPGAERTPSAGDVARQHALGVEAAVRALRLRRVAVAAQVGHDDAMPGGGEARRDASGSMSWSSPG